MSVMDAEIGRSWSRAADEPASRNTSKDPARQAFDARLAALRPRLVRLIAARTRSHADAEDTVQEALLRAWRFRDRYDPTRPLAAWLYRIALRAQADQHRRRRPGTRPELPPQADAAPGPMAVAVASEQADRLWRVAQATLTQDQFTAVWLAYVEQLSPREIAHATGRRAGAVRVALHRARARLADALSHDPPAHDTPSKGPSS